VHEGDAVQAGQLLATIDNPDVEADANGVARELELADSNLRQAQERGDLERASRATNDRNRVLEELSVAQKRAAALEIRAPAAGVVTTPQVDQRAGEFLAQGAEFCELADRSTMKARILVRDWELDDIHAGSAASLKVTPYAFRTYSGNVARILPAAAEDVPVSRPERTLRFGQQLANYVAVEMVFPNPDGSLLEGMTGTAKITGKPYPVAWQAGRGAWRWLRSQVW